MYRFIVFFSFYFAQLAKKLAWIGLAYLT